MYLKKTASILQTIALVASLSHIAHGEQNLNAEVKLFPREAHPSATTLVPYQWHLGGSSDQAVEMPKLGQAVELLYGEDLPENTPANIDPFVTRVKFLPASNRAILALEKYLLRPTQESGLLLEVTCEGSQAALNQVRLEMKGSGQQVKTFNRWLGDILHQENKELVVITSDDMRGCGKKERNGFLVNSVNFDDLTTTLNVTPLEWSTVSVRVSVEFGRVSAMSLGKRFDSGKMRPIVPRDDEGSTKPNSTTEDDGGITQEGIITIDPSIEPRLQLYPLPDIVSKLDIGLPFEIPFLPNEEGNETAPTAPDPLFTVTCLNCVLTGLLEYNGEFEMDFIDIKTAFIEVAVTEDLVARMELEFATGDTPFMYAFETSIFPIIGAQKGLALPGWGIPSLFVVVPYFDYSIGVSIEVGAPKVNVSYGGELRVPKGAKLRWDISGNTSSRTNWDVEVTTFPMRAAEMDVTDFSLGLNFSSIPSVLMNLEVMGILPGEPAQIGAKLAMIMPRLYTKSTIMKDVTASCTPPPADDFTYFPYAIDFESGFYTALIGVLFAEIGIDFGPNITISGGTSFTHTILERTFPLPPACFLFGDSKTGQGAFRNASLPEAAVEKVLNVAKIENFFKDTGEIPASVDLVELAAQEGLPADLKAAIEKVDKTTGNAKGNTTFNQQNHPKNENGVTRLEASVWVSAILAFGAAFF